ncbi:peptide MFS transporter [Parasphingorhabdus sp.]|uniref:peptide MFS transporter n=1 Tax=Parasphingorhabdus sp. TaxID=2709688 RepID=UPI0030031ED1
MMVATEKTWFGQPRGLTILFLTNMWEQFSYFGMRALLIYYMTKELLIDQQTSSFIYGSYTALAYFTPIVGGAIADRWLGKRKAVIIGATIMAAGHFMMAFEPMLYVALATIALGNGLFLPTLPSQINDLYGPGDPRRPWAYNVYYVGINIGGFLAPLVCGTLGEVYGWHWGFGAAGIGMFLGLLIYLVGGKYLPPEPSRFASASDEKRPNDFRPYLFLLGIGLAVTVFRGAYEQVGNTVALWADTGVDRLVAGWTVPMTWFQSLNPLLVILMTPLLLAHWQRRAVGGKEHEPIIKMAIGALIVACAYLVLAAATVISGDDRANALWLVAFFAIFTLGELYILPNGLGLFARLAPPRFGATTVAAWYLTIFSGSLAAGLVGTLWSVFERPVFFLILAGIATISAGILYLLSPTAARVIAEHDQAVRPQLLPIDKLSN